MSAPPPIEHSEGALDPYLRALRTHWRLVILVTLAAVAGSITWVILREPDYEASAQILISPLAPDDQAFEGVDVLRSDPSDSTRTVQTAATLIDSPEAAARAAKKLGPDWSRERVEDQVDVETRGETNILSITALAPSPEGAVRLANTFARASLDERASTVGDQASAKLDALRASQQAGGLEGDAAVELATSIERLETAGTTGDPAFSLTQEAVPATSPVQTPAWLVVGLSLLAGFTLATGTALLLELLNRRIRDEDELRRLYPLPILAHVPVVSGRQRKGLKSPVSTPPAVREAFRTLQVQLDRAGRLPRVLMLTSASSGDAKTTAAVNLSITLVAGGSRVILIDFDLRKPDLGQMLEASPVQPLVSLLTPGARIDDLLVDARQIPSLRVLPADPERDAILLEPLSLRLPELFDEARSLADYVIVDTPPLGEVSDALRLIDVVDDLVIVVRPGHTNRTNFELMRDALARTGRSPLGMLVIGDAPGSVSSYYTYGMGTRHGSVLPSATPPVKP